MSRDFHCISRPVARKQHQCDDCGCRIQPSEKYLRGAGKWEGDFTAFVSCEACDAFRKQMQNDTDWAWDEMPPLGQIADCLKEAYEGQLPPYALAFLARRQSA